MKTKMSISEACEKYGISRSAITCAIGRGVIKRMKVGRRTFVSEATIQDYVENHARKRGGHQKRKRKASRMSADQFSKLPDEVLKDMRVREGTTGDAELRAVALDAMCILLVLDVAGSCHVDQDDLHSCINRLKSALRR